MITLLIRKYIFKNDKIDSSILKSVFKIYIEFFAFFFMFNIGRSFVDFEELRRLQLLELKENSTLILHLPAIYDHICERAKEFLFISKDKYMHSLRLFQWIFLLMQVEFFALIATSTLIKRKEATSNMDNKTWKIMGAVLNVHRIIVLNIYRFVALALFVIFISWLIFYL